MTDSALGIGIGKRKFNVVLLINGKAKTKAVKNSSEGFQMLGDWLEKHGAGRVHARVEATGNYGEELAFFLRDAGHVVSVVNPACIKGFAQCKLSRTETDAADADLRARFCLATEPAAWSPLPLKTRGLQAVVRRIDALAGMRAQESNRLDVSHGLVKPSIKKLIAHLDSEPKN